MDHVKLDLTPSKTPKRASSSSIAVAYLYIFEESPMRVPIVKAIDKILSLKSIPTSRL